MVVLQLLFAHKSALMQQEYLLIMTCHCRERKRERDREDLWRKLEALSLTNARKEGISLEYINHVVRSTMGIIQEVKK